MRSSRHRLSGPPETPTTTGFADSIWHFCCKIEWKRSSIVKTIIASKYLFRGAAMPEKILIVDDDVDTLRLVGLMLQRQGYQIVAANNGHQALTMAQSEKPDLILLDVMMPDMDGYEVTRRLRGSATTSSIPIIMFTAKSQVDDKVTGFDVGADDYLTKPTQPRELFAHVKAVLARGRKGGAAASATPA
ncbi:MAG: response regulator, partial [Chloroflexi bacterium]